MAFLPPSAKLPAPTHKVVGPDGAEYFLIRCTRNTVRIKILFDAPNWVDTTPAGSVSRGWGPSAADAIRAGNCTGPLIHHFTSAALDLLPDGTRCVEVEPEPSAYDYRTDVIWSGWEGGGYRPDIAFVRVGLRETPLFRPERAAARPLIEAHRQALRDGTFLPEATPEAQAEFLADAERALAYLDFMDTVPELAQRPRKVYAA